MGPAMATCWGRVEPGLWDSCLGQAMPGGTPCPKGLAGSGVGTGSAPSGATLALRDPYDCSPRG